MAGVSAADLSLLGESPSLEKIVKWAQLSMARVGVLLGIGAEEVVDVPLSTFAMFSVDEYEKLVGDWGKDSPAAQAASPLELARARLLRAACIALSGSLPRAPSTQTPEVAPVASASTSVAKKIKTSSVIDVTDESEIP
eukprot:2269286-Amphidinium_carterae.1